MTSAKFFIQYLFHNGFLKCVPRHCHVHMKKVIVAKNTENWYFLLISTDFHEFTKWAIFSVSASPK